MGGENSCFPFALHNGKEVFLCQGVWENLLPRPITAPFRVYGDRLRAAREAAGFKVGECADRLRISRQSYGSYENGRALPPALKRPTIAAALGTTEGAIWGDGESTERNAPRPRLVRERPYGHNTPTTPAAAIYYAVSQMMDTCADLSREAARMASEESTYRPPKE